METQFLINTESTSEVVNNISGLIQITVSSHNGGTWTLQRQAPDNTNWIDLDVTFVADGAKVFYAVDGVPYRLNGGTVGATGWYGKVISTIIERPDYDVPDRSRAIPLS